MTLSTKETYGPLDRDDLERLRQAVVRDFPIRDGNLTVHKQTWDGLLVGINSGASRRFSLLRRLQPNLEFNALITPYSLDKQWWRDVCGQRNFIGVEDQQWEVQEAFRGLADMVPSFEWLRVEHEIYQYESHAAFMIVPAFIPNAPARVQTLLSALSEKLWVHFNLGRYLLERSCQSRMKTLILERSPV